MQKKEFSILKWIVFPANSIVLAAIIAYFNITVFGLRDGLPYSIIVGMIGLFSIVIVKYAESDNRSLARAAFVFEIGLTAALIINAVYSVSVQRKMSVAKMAETSQADTIDKISKLRGSRTQREALKKIDKQETAQTVFTGVEDVLFWIMTAELALYGLSAFTLFALAKLIGDEEPKEQIITDHFPEELDAIENRLPIKRENLARKKKLERIIDSFDSAQYAAGAKALRDVLRDISFRLKGRSFKVTVKPNCVWIMMVEANQGTQQSVASARCDLAILRDAETMPRDQFRVKLERTLQRGGFEI